MEKTYIIVGLTHREATFHHRELAETRPELRNRNRVIVIPIEHAGIRGVLRGRSPEYTEVIVMPRAWHHRRAGTFANDLRLFRQRAVA